MTITRPLNTAQNIVNFVATMPAGMSVVAAVVVAVALGAGAPVHADVYRWVADDGTVNYGEREPRGREFTVISRNGAETKNTKNASAANTNAASNAQSLAAATPSGAEADSEQNLSEKQQAMLDRMKADEAKRLENLAEIRKSNCASSKRLLTKMQTRGRIRVRNDDGEETAMTDQARSEEIRKAQEAIAVNCESLS